jgi:hypothetical protein
MSAETVGVLRKSKPILLSSTIVLSLLTLPMLVAFTTIRWRFLFNLFAADSMYYMGIANNWVKFGFPTFDGEEITNGFHPLWELVLAGVFWISGVPNENQLYVTFALSLALVLVSLTLLGSLAIRHLGVVRGATGIFMLFPGAYTLLGNPTSRTSGDPGVLYRLEPWSAINGIESTLSMALWSIAIYLLMRRLDACKENNAATEQSGVWTHLFDYRVRVVLAAIVLARVDDAIVLGTIVMIVWVFNTGTTAQRVYQISRILLLPVMALVVYTLVNIAATGSPFQTSGMSKTGLSLALNIPMLAGAVIGLSHRWDWIYAAERAYPLIFCSVVSGISLVLLNTALKEIRDKSRVYQLALILFFYVLIKSLFFISFVKLYSQGYWYYFVIVLLLNFIIAIVVVRMIPARGIYKYTALIGAATVTTLSVGTEGHMMSSTEGMLGNHSISNYAETAYTLWTHKHEIREAFGRRDPSAKLIDNLDGMYGFLLDMPAASVTGLVSGRRDLNDRGRVGFWNSILPRGYSIISSVGYINPLEEKTIRLREVYRSVDGKIVFFQVIPADSASAIRQ